MSRIVPVMKLNEDVPASINLIRAYSAREITVGVQRLAAPCLIAPQRLVSPWPVSDVEALDEASLEAIWPLGAQLVLLGTGSRQRFAPASVRAAFARRRVALESMDLGAACRTYNVLAQEDRLVVAALLPDAQP